MGMRWAFDAIESQSELSRTGVRISSSPPYARLVELVDTLVLGTSSQEWEFKSLIGYHINSYHNGLGASAEGGLQRSELIKIMIVTTPAASELDVAPCKIFW